MAESAPPRADTSGVAPVVTHRLTPPGVLPRHGQVWLMVGVAGDRTRPRSASIREHQLPTRSPAAGGFSDAELRAARAYLALPASREYLRERHDNPLSRGAHATGTPPAIKARHVAAVLRGRGPDPPATSAPEILRAAEQGAGSEHVAGSAHGLARSPRAAEQSAQRSTGHSAGQHS